MTGGDLAPPPRRGGAQIIPRPEIWSVGSAAPWLVPGTGDLAAPCGVAEVVAALGAHHAPRPLEPFAEARNSAVLIGLVDGDRGAEVLLTRRSWQLTNHKGEISFPGGRMDPGESPVDTALREAWEEVGLDPNLVSVHGELEHLHTYVSRSYIVPVVASLATKPTLTPAAAEVDRILFVPLVDLAAPETHREEIWHRPEADLVLQFFELEDETIWGATGRMLAQLLDLVYGPPATRTAL